MRQWRGGDRNQSLAGGGGVGRGRGEGIDEGAAAPTHLS